MSAKKTGKVTIPFPNQGFIGALRDELLESPKGLRKFQED